MRASSHRLGPALLAGALLFAAVSAAEAAPSKREMQAREDYGAGRYQQALELFAKLYAETLHPTYLRNIGRCYQNLGQPDKAITSFREYLRKAKGVPPDERAELDGYIREMEELKKSAAAPHPEPTPPPPILVVRPPIESRSPVLVEKAPPPAARPAVYERGWFWALAGVIVLGGVAGGLVAAGVFSSKGPSCPPMIVCK